MILLHIYFVSFLDKPEKSAPQLSPRAIEQRAKWGIPTDQMDYPVSPMYMSEMEKAGAKIYHKSRWFNGVTCEMDSATAAKVADLKFVTSVEMTREDKAGNNAPRRSKWANEQLFGAVDAEIERWSDEQQAVYNLTPLHEAGYKGQGILMTVCDNGFYNANTLTCFRQDSMELGHFDLTDDPYDFYGWTGGHGVKCLSLIAAQGQNYMGAAPEAQYYLMRSEEHDTESPKEMDNLVVAMETADSLGVNIMSISLGYAKFDKAEWTLPKSALDGKTTRVSRAATIAARKGMLVCVAAGNEGNSSWRTINVPAEADSVLTVGAVDTLGVIGGFSSYGPSADGRIKPDVCAVGVQASFVGADGYIATGNGTSFATPLLAGMAACLWSALPDENAMQIRERIIRSANRYTHPDTSDYLYGYGIPDAWEAYSMHPQGIDNGQSTKDKGRWIKVLRNGQLYLMYDGQMYDSSGRVIK